MLQAHSFDEQLPLINRHFFALTVLALMILFINLHVGDLAGYDDAYHAEEARTMLQSGDYWTVRHNGLYNPQFPPLFYWIEALSMKVWGVNDFAVKFPSPLFAVGAIIVTYFIAFELTGQIWLALISMAVMMTSQFFMKYATHAMTDATYTFFFAAAILFYLKAFRQPRFFWLSGLAVALSLLTRPFISVILLAIFFTHLLWSRRKALLWSPYVLSGLCLALLFPAIWYVIQYRLHGNEGFAGTYRLMSAQISEHRMPELKNVLWGLVKYCAHLILKYNIWLIPMLLGLKKQIGKSFRQRDFTATLLVAWVAWVFIPFSLSSLGQLRYIIPIFPAFAILAAMPISRWIPMRMRRTFLYGFYVLGIAIVIFMHFRPGNLMRAEDMRALAPVVAAHTPPGQRVILYTEGGPQWNYQNQLIWYANRYTELTTTFEAVLGFMKANPEVPVVMDRKSFPQFVQLAGSAYRIALLCESKRYCCFRAEAVMKTF